MLIIEWNFLSISLVVFHTLTAYVFRYKLTLYLFNDLRYVRLLLSTIGTPFLLLIAICVVSMSINIFRVSWHNVSYCILSSITGEISDHTHKKFYITLQFLKAMTEFIEVLNILTSTSLIFIHMCFIFIGNYLGQQITNCNAEIPMTVWVSISSKFRKNCPSSRFLNALCYSFHMGAYND